MAQWCVTVDDEVKASAIVRRDTRAVVLTSHCWGTMCPGDQQLRGQRCTTLAQPAWIAWPGGQSGGTLVHGHQMHQRGRHTQVQRRSRNGQARAGVGAGVRERGVGIAGDGLEAEKAAARGRGRKGSECATHSVATRASIQKFLAPTA